MLCVVFHTDLNLLDLCMIKKMLSAKIKDRLLEISASGFHAKAFGHLPIVCFSDKSWRATEKVVGVYKLVYINCILL